MSDYTAPLEDIQFSMFNVLDGATRLQNAGYEIDEDTLASILEGYSEFAVPTLAPINAPGDVEGCTWHPDHTVTTPKGYKEAYQAFCEGGWPGLNDDEEYGGAAMPHTVFTMIHEVSNACANAWMMYPGLSAHARDAIEAGASKELKDMVMPKLVSGEWTGTMCLTEPQAGTDLGLLKTKAVKNEDGTYSITGGKIFISAGEHDYTDNIIHLVLARTPDAPAGSRGISLFVVPRNEILEDGSVGERNGVYCDGIEEKMGIHGSATCVMRFENAKGWIVGEENKGLAGMFVMMNKARVGVAAQGNGVASRSFQNSLRYAKERLQSRAPKSLKGESTDVSSADPIIMQPDVRRMLLTQKAWVDGSRMLLHDITIESDIAASSSVDDAERARAFGRVELLTPITKAFITDRSVEVTSLGMQVFGGMGFIRETGQEQFLRDTRILPIYEGTNGVQALDLIGRKVLKDGGKRLNEFAGDIQKVAAELPEEIAYMGQDLLKWAQTVGEVTQKIGAEAAQNDIRPLASATAYQDVLGHVVYGYYFARSAKAALEVLAGDAANKTAKEQLALAKFYFAELLPAAAGPLARVFTPTDILMDPAAIGE